MNWLSEAIQITHLTQELQMRSLSPSLALGRDRQVYMAWSEQTVQAPQPIHVYFKRSLDNGATWPQDGVQIDHAPSPGVQSGASPLMAADELGNVYMAWEVRPEFPPGNAIFLNRSSDDGATWQTADQRIDGSFRALLSLYNFQHQPDLLSADNQGHVHVIFYQPSGTFPEYFKIAFNSSADFGATWNPQAKVVMNRPANYVYHSLEMTANQNGKIFILTGGITRGGTREHVYLNASRDYGRSWTCKGRGCQVESIDPVRDGIRTYVGQISCNQNGRCAIIWSDDRTDKTIAERHLYYNTADLT